MKHFPHERALRAGSMVVAALLAGCASAPPAEAPKLERLTATDLAARIAAPTAAVTLDEVAAMAQRGESASAIIARLDATHSTHRLNAGQIGALIASHVPLAVIDHILETERRRIFDDLAADLARRDQACAERVEQVEREARLCRLQSMQPWPGVANCWPPHVGTPYWRCY